MLQTQKNRLYKLKTTLLYAIISAQNPKFRILFIDIVSRRQLVLHQTPRNQPNVQGFRYGLVRS